jgi:hypothetical protein
MMLTAPKILGSEPCASIAPYIFGRDVVGLVVSTLQRLSSGACHVEDAAVVTFMLNRKKPLARVWLGGPDAFEITPEGRQWLGRPRRGPRGAKPQKQGVLERDAAAH